MTHAFHISWMLLAVAWCAIAQPVALSPIFPDHVKEHSRKALDALLMSETDARFEKNHGEPVWTLSWITNSLNDPWRLPGQAEKIYTAVLSARSDELWSVAADMMELNTPGSAGTFPVQPGSIAITFAGLDESIAAAASNFIQECTAARILFEQAMTNLNTEERIYLAASVLSPAYDTEMNLSARDLLIAAGIPREVQERIEVESELLDGTEVALAWLALINRIDFTLLHQSSLRLQRAASKLAATAAGTAAPWPDQMMTYQSPFGVIHIGTINADVYEGEAWLVLDPGGDDQYRDGPGSVNGLVSQSISVIVDLGGNDRYSSKQLCGVGASLFGMAIVMDLNGDDSYHAEGNGSGSGIFGSGWLEDSTGNDQYSGYVFNQGAAVSGFGMLMDGAGRDRYDAGYYSQGFAGVKGWGLLADRQGHDVYFAGNRLRDSDRNVDRYLSLSQGFSIGARPHAGGGVAALVDLEGNDTYTADVFGQGVSYYYSAGFLLDGDGNDRYSVYQYGQGCGIHLSLGLLADASGDDLYSGYILSQGAAHDYAVGMMFDHEGNDTYTADHHAQGRALNNAFALLVDRAGDDAYFGRQRDQTQGVGNEGGFRDYGSLALLLDLAGQDIYSGGFSNRAITLRPLYGAVYDVEEGPDE